MVIGGGIVGAATAFFARRAGLDVVLLEKRAALCTLTTPVSTGAFRLQFDNPEEINLVRESIALFDAFAEVAELPGVRPRRFASRATCSAPPARPARSTSATSSTRCTVGAWTTSSCSAVTRRGTDFRISVPDIIQARFRAADGWLDPKALTFGYARASGATICLETPAIGFTLRGDRVVGVHTPRGTIDCAHVVIATGPFAAPVAALAGLRLDLRPTIRHKLVHARGARAADRLADDHPRGDGQPLAARSGRLLRAVDRSGNAAPASRSRTCRPTPSSRSGCWIRRHRARSPA